MKKRVLMMLVAAGLLAGMLPGVALAGGPNQGRADMVLTVDGNEGCDCKDPVPGEKVEGDNLGRFEQVYSSDPIAYVTVKSGKNAEVDWSDSGSSEGGSYWVKFKLSKDISNYIVWTCPGETDPDPPNTLPES